MTTAVAGSSYGWSGTRWTSRVLDVIRRRPELVTAAVCAVVVAIGQRGPDLPAPAYPAPLLPHPAGPGLPGPAPPPPRSPPLRQPLVRRPLAARLQHDLPAPRRRARFAAR